MESGNVDVRWKQRFANYVKALGKLNEALSIVSSHLDYGREIDELLQEGLIQRFEYTHELAWNVMKDYAEYQGFTDIKGSRDAIRKALRMGLIVDAEWMHTIEDRNISSHNYDNDTAQAVLSKITGVYGPLFNAFKTQMETLLND